MDALIVQEQEAEEVKLFLESLRTEGTKYTYSKAFRLMFQDKVDQFLALAKKDKKQAEAELIKWILSNKEKRSGSTIRTWLAAVRSLCDFYEVPLNWKKIIKISPHLSKAQDRAPLLNEIRALFNVSDKRIKFVITLLASSGARIGAFDYFTVGDIELVPEGIGIITVYRGEPEEYRTFISSECVEYFKAYISERQRAEEAITKDSPLIARMINLAVKGRTVKRIDSSGLHGIFGYQWKRVGIVDREFKVLHGFRKFFKTRLESAGMKTIMIEQLLGHVSGLSANYYRPTVEELKKEYLKFQFALYINEALEAKTEAIVIQDESNRKFNETRAELIAAQRDLMYQTAQLNQLKKEYEEQRVKRDDFDQLKALVLKLEAVVMKNQVSYKIMTPEQKTLADKKLQELQPLV